MGDELRHWRECSACGTDGKSVARPGLGYLDWTHSEGTGIPCSGSKETAGLVGQAVWVRHVHRSMGFFFLQVIFWRMERRCIKDCSVLQRTCLLSTTGAKSLDQNDGGLDGRGNHIVNLSKRMTLALRSGWLI